MAYRIEWRSRAERDDTLLVIEPESNAVVKAFSANADLLTDFLNDMEGLDDQPDERKSDNGVDHIGRGPQDFGELVMARSDEGDVLALDPERYWDGIMLWFRSQGRDPHLYRPKP